MPLVQKNDSFELTDTQFRNHMKEAEGHLSLICLTPNTAFLIKIQYIHPMQYYQQELFTLLVWWNLLLLSLLSHHKLRKETLVHSVQRRSIHNEILGYDVWYLWSLGFWISLLSLLHHNANLCTVLISVCSSHQQHQHRRFVDQHRNSIGTENATTRSSLLSPADVYQSNVRHVIILYSAVWWYDNVTRRWMQFGNPWILAFQNTNQSNQVACSCLCS